MIVQDQLHATLGDESNAIIWPREEKEEEEEQKSDMEEDDEYDILCLGMSFKPIPGLFARPDAPKRRIPQVPLCRNVLPLDFIR